MTMEQTIHDIQPSKETLPWIHVVERDCHHSLSVTAKKSGAQFRAIFAGQVKLKSYDERFAFRWGWSDESLRQEALSRMRQFIVSLHGAGQFAFEKNEQQPTVALHAYVDHSNSGVRFSILGAVNSYTKKDACEKAVDLWRLILANFPYDYELTPIQTYEEYDNLTGLCLLRKIAKPREVAEVQRFEVPLPTDQGPILLLSSWNSLERADEQIWRALSGLNQPTLLSVRVQPTQLSEQEWSNLSAWGKVAAGEYQKVNNQIYKRHYHWASVLYKQRLHDWQLPFLLQLHLATKGGVPRYLLRTIGSALTYKPSKDWNQPLFQFANPSNESQCEIWQSQLANLEQTKSHNGNNRFMSRLHITTSIDEVLTVFCLPYLLKAGLPGSEFV